MKLIVCIKQVPAENNLQINQKSCTLNRDSAQLIINPYDLFAVEEALRLKEKNNGMLTALSMGTKNALEILKYVMGLGADNGILLNDSKFAGSDSLATSYILSRAIKKQKFDLVICGKKSIDGETAQVGPGLAELLGIPHITNVCEIISSDDKSLICRRQTEKKEEVLRLKLPGLITVTNTFNIPRRPSLRNVIKSRKAAPDLLNAEDLDVNLKQCGLSGSCTKVIKVFIPEYKVENQMFYGAPEEQVKALVSVIREHNQKNATHNRK